MDNSQVSTWQAAAEPGSPGSPNSSQGSERVQAPHSTAGSLDTLFQAAQMGAWQQGCGSLGSSASLINFLLKVNFSKQHVGISILQENSKFPTRNDVIHVFIVEFPMEWEFQVPTSLNVFTKLFGAGTISYHG